MLLLFALPLLKLAVGSQAATNTLSRQLPNDGIHLAVGPQCGQLGGTVNDVNAGLDLNKYKTIVSFGDSYTDGGKEDGSPLLPPVIDPPDLFAGGRSTNGKIWIENIADDIGARLMDYAVSSAVVNISLWPNNPRPVDFIQQTTLFLSQSNNLDPDTTLYTVFFGINDWEDSLTGPDNLPEAAQDLLGQMKLLASPPTNARNFLVTDVYGRGNSTASGQAWLQSIFDGLTAFHKESPPLNVAFANFARIWDGVLGPVPGYQAFGYESTSACVDGDTVTCAHPQYHFYWFSGHPSKETHRIMADYVELVLSLCNTGALL